MSDLIALQHDALAFVGERQLVAHIRLPLPALAGSGWLPQTLTAVTAAFTLTLRLRLAGATTSGWLADRIGRKEPLMISIA